MVDVKNSKWLQEMKKLTAEKKKKLLKKDLITIGCLFLFGILVFIGTCIIDAVDIGVYIILSDCMWILVMILVVLYHLLLSTRALEKQMRKVLVTEELLEQFDDEMISAPKGLVEITGGRVLYTEHFVMSQYEKPGKHRFSRILLWDKMDEMKTTIYKTNAQTNGIVTRFYKSGEKKCCQSIEFKEGKDSDAFLTKLTELKPDIGMR